jgi:hypothetical protein
LPPFFPLHRGEGGLSTDQSNKHFTAIGSLFTLYAFYDMVTTNRQRKHQFLDVQRRLESESLEAARLAYIRGDASPEQVELVEYVRELETKQAQGFKMPSILGAPKPRAGEEAADDVPRWGEEGAAAAAAAAAAEGKIAKAPEKEGIRGWLFSGLKVEDRDGSSPKGVQQTLAERAKAAYAQEKQNQERGGPLDQLGTEGGGKKKERGGWW